MNLLWKSLALLLFSFVMILPGAFAAEPLSGKTIYVDAGHGGDDSGAVGNGLLEKDVNLDVSNLLNEKLEKEGADTVVTRTGDSFLSLEERVAKASTNGSDLFISIHANSAAPEAAGTRHILTPHIKRLTANGWRRTFRSIFPALSAPRTGE